MSRDLTIVIPTVTGREAHLEELGRRLDETAPLAARLIYLNRATCGEVWNAGAQHAKTPLVTMLADDLLPYDGWWEAAAGVVERGYVPAPYLYTLADVGGPSERREFESGGAWKTMLPAGAPTGWAAVPFCRTADWVTIPPIHYFSDNAYTDAQRYFGRPAIVEPRFAFDHVWAQPGRQPMQGARWYAEQAEWEAFRAHLPASHTVT